MVAPSAPRLYARQDGTNVYVRWLPVLNATDYTLYLKEALEAYGIQAQFVDDDVEDDGWFFSVEGPFAGIVTVKLTALNALAEESGDSNEVQLNLRGGGIEVVPSDALEHQRKGY